MERKPVYEHVWGMIVDLTDAQSADVQQRVRELANKYRGCFLEMRVHYNGEVSVRVAAGWKPFDLN